MGEANCVRKWNSVQKLARQRRISQRGSSQQEECFLYLALVIFVQRGIYKISSIILSMEGWKLYNGAYLQIYIRVGKRRNGEYENQVSCSETWEVIKSMTGEPIASKCSQFSSKLAAWKMTTTCWRTVHWGGPLNGDADSLLKFPQHMAQVVGHYKLYKQSVRPPPVENTTTSPFNGPPQ